MYKVINAFRDLKDKETLYSIGDEYPKTSHKPTKKRIEELSKVHPVHNVIFIEAIGIDVEEEEKE